MNTTSAQLILMRHGARASSFDNDTALSVTGHAQAAAAPEIFKLLTPREHQSALPTSRFHINTDSPSHSRSGTPANSQANSQVNSQANSNSKFAPRPHLIFTSPKLRARQTVTPLAQALNVKIEVEERLDERHNEESRAAFDARIRSFLEMVNQRLRNRESMENFAILACSHMDWLEAVLPLMNSNLSARDLSLPWAAGEYRCFNLNAELIWELSNTGVLPEFASSFS